MRHSKIYDADLEFKDAGAVTSSAAAQVDSTDKIIDLGAGYYEGDMVIDVSAIEIASNTEYYTIGIQVSSSATFASTYATVAALTLGANEVLSGDIDSAIGRYVLPFHNEHQGTIYRYARIYTTVGGDVSTGINYAAFATKR